MDCQIECKTNYTLEKCGCVDFYMPSEKKILYVVETLNVPTNY